MTQLERGQVNLITFVLIDASGAEVAGLGTSFVLQLAKAGGAFAASDGTKAEMGLGWYSYEVTAAEADTRGPLSVVVNGTGALQQNLEYIVDARNIYALEFTYTVDDGTDPIDGAQVWITTDLAGNDTIWNGVTDSLGAARDINGRLPFLDPGTYYFWVQKSGYSFTNPDTEVVS